jgi:hypothetical protein
VICDEIKKRHGNFVMDQGISCSVVVTLEWTQLGPRIASFEVRNGFGVCVVEAC